MLCSQILAGVLFAVSAAARAMPYNHPRVEVRLEHIEVMNMRVLGEVNTAALRDVKCEDSKSHIVFHDQNVAELSICGGISGAVTKCQGNPSSTTGEAGSAKFELAAVESGATINISKVRWEQCVRAARDACPTGSMAGTCVGGATRGDVVFKLGNP